MKIYFSKKKKQKIVNIATQLTKINARNAN